MASLPSPVQCFEIGRLESCVGLVVILSDFSGHCSGSSSSTLSDVVLVRPVGTIGDAKNNIRPILPKYQRKGHALQVGTSGF